MRSYYLGTMFLVRSKIKVRKFVVNFSDCKGQISWIFQNLGKYYKELCNAPTDLIGSANKQVRTKTEKNVLLQAKTFKFFSRSLVFPEKIVIDLE